MDSTTTPHSSFGIPLVTQLIDRHCNRWRVDENVIAYWSQLSSRAGKKAGNTAAVEDTARHYGECTRSIYRKISVFRLALTSALIEASHDSTLLHWFSEAVYRYRGSNQRLRFEAAIAATAAHTQKLKIIAIEPCDDLMFDKGLRCRDHRSRNSVLSSDDLGVQGHLLGLTQSLVAAAHSAMTGFLDVRGWGERLCRSISQYSTTSIFRDDQPDSRWLAGVGLSWLPSNPRDSAVVAKEREFRALGYQTIASAYRQLVAHRKTARWQKQYLSSAKRFALKAQNYAAPGGVSGPFLQTFEVLAKPDSFDSLPWKSQTLGLTEALEIANAGVMARRFREAESVLDTVMMRIPEENLPVRSRAVRLELACRLALGRRPKQFRDEARQLCALFPHDRHMLGLVEVTKGDLRQVYQS
jgi:hypothetical protein